MKRIRFKWLIFAAFLLISLAIFLIVNLTHESSWVRDIGPCTISVSYRGRSSSCSVIKLDDRYVMEADRYVIIVQNTNLFVNYKDYGVFPEGAQIHVTEDKVTVDGQLRNGTPISRAQCFKLSGEKQTKHYLAECKVVVVPYWGNVCHTTYWFSNTEKLEIGPHVIVMKKGSIMVDGVNYGLVEDDQFVHIDFGEVRIK